MPPTPAAVSAGPFAAVLAVQLLLVAAAALAGGASLSFLTLGHRRMQVLLSLTGGVLLGVGLLHLLPHAAGALGGDLDATMGWVLAGFFGMFVLERAFHAHAHHAADAAASDEPGTEPGVAAGHPGCRHGPPGDHGHGHDHGHDRRPVVVGAPAGGRWSWCAAFAGLALHGLADGAALAASTLSEGEHGAGWLAGGATFLAVLLHKPFDAAIIAALLLGAGAGRTARRLANVAYALVVPLGAVAFLVTLRLSGAAPGPVVGVAMAVAAGAFVCIAAADLLPEVQFHSHDRVLLTTSLALGLAIAWGVGLLERGAHDHARPAPPAAAGSPRP